MRLSTGGARVMQMDVGVGSFVLANAVVSREARGLPVAPQPLLRSVGPLLMLGVGRLVATTATSYHVRPPYTSRAVPQRAHCAAFG
jgi:hypothetical protein